MNLEYNNYFENILKKECEICECLYLMHQRAGEFYNKLAVLINIPIILLSAFSSFLNILVLFEGQNILVSSIILFITIIKTIDSYFQFSKRSENHKIIALSYNKIFRLIYIQLSLPRESRIQPYDFYKMITDDIQYIKQNENNIPSYIINHFIQKYRNTRNHFPSICNGLTTIHIYNEHFEDDIATSSSSDIIVNDRNENLPI